MADTASDFQAMLDKQAEQQAVQQAVAQAEPDQKAALAELIKRREQEELQRKELLRQQLEAQLKASPTNIDFTPLAAQLQDMYGGKAPVAAAQSNLAYGKDAQERTDKLFDELTKPTKESSLANALGQDGRQARFDEAQGLKIEKDIRDQKTKIDRDASKIISGFATVESAFTPDKDGNLDLQKVMSGLSNYARNIGEEKGALNEGDVDRAAYIRDYLTMFEGLKLKFGERGKISQDKMQPYLDRLIESKESQRQRLKSNTELLRNAYAQAPSTAKYFEKPESYGNKIFEDTFKVVDSAGYINPALRAKPEKKDGPVKEKVKSTIDTAKKTTEELLQMSKEELAAYEAKLLGE
jgi:hypothetical protein